MPGPSRKAWVLLLKLARVAVVLSLNHFCFGLLNWLITSGGDKGQISVTVSQKNLS